MDSPAVEVEFLVLKNREDSDMAEVSDSKAAKPASTAAVEQVPVEQDTGEGEGVAAALKSVTQIVDSIAGIVKDAKPDGEADPSADGETDTAKTDDKKAKEEADKKAKEEADKKAKEEADKKAKTEKAAADALAAGTTDTEKAKAFTPARIAQIEGALKTLQGLLASVKGEVKDESKTEKSTDAAMTKITSTLESFTTTLKSVGEGIKALDERVKKIEGERPASNSTDDDGGTDTPTDKSQDLWAGVL